MSNLEKKSPIKTYAIRRGRLTTEQKKALGAQSLYLLETECLQPKELAWLPVFSCKKPIWMEIGFGMGDTLFANACVHPHLNFIGVEVYAKGVGRLLTQLQATHPPVCNLRIVHSDVMDMLPCIPNAFLAGVQILFPDPWPKTRHHKRRLVQPDFIQMLITKLKKGGRLHIATDWADYATQIQAVLSLNKQLIQVHAECGLPGRGLSKYEQRGQRLGHSIFEYHAIFG